MFNSEGAQVDPVNVTPLLVEQKEIQDFLGNLPPKKDETIVSSDLLHKVLQFAHYAFTEENKRLELQLSVKGLKVGYERKFSTDSDSYIVVRTRSNRRFGRMRLCSSFSVG